MKTITKIELVIFLMAVILITSGGILNELVIINNGGRMPVINPPGCYFEPINTSTHFNFVYPSQINNYRLADIYIAPVNFNNLFLFFSIGDVLAVSGLLLTILWGMFVLKIKYLTWRGKKK